MRRGTGEAIKTLPAAQNTRKIHTQKRKRMTNQQTLSAKLLRVVPAAVYGGAGLLVLIVGLRGLGNISSFIPSVLLGGDGRLSPAVVGIGLIAEFILLMLMAYVVFLKSRGTQQHSRERDEVVQAVARLEEYTGSMDRRVDGLVTDLSKLGNKFERLIESERRFVEALNEHIETETSVRKSLLSRIDENTGSLKEVQHMMQRVFRITSA
jgi:hypothetical protein